VEDFKKLGAEVVACSVDSEFSHLAWINTPRKQGGLGQMKIPIVSDISKSIAKQYGVLINDSVALRGLFIMDKSNKIRHATINDLPIGRSVDEALRVLQAVQFTDEHGEGWLFPFV
jgi:alkyl hydroperoxide reductase subunit AhpC